MQRAARVDTFGGPICIVQEPIPEPQSDELLVEIKASGVCHTDAHLSAGDWEHLKAPLPFCPGHEGVGVVCKKGSGVDNFELGDPVGIPWLWKSCGACEQCINGWETLCLKQKNTSFDVGGCFRQFVCVPAGHAIRLPRNLPFDQAAPIMCAGVTSYKALKLCDATAGQFVCIVGAAGGLGHLAVQYARAMGYRVIATDLGPQLSEYCTSLGAEHYVDATDFDGMVAEIHKYTDGGCHAVIAIAPHVDGFRAAIAMSRRHGTVVCVGLPKDETKIDMLAVVLNGLTLRGSILGTRMDIHEALDFAARGLVTCRVTKEKMERVNEVMDRLRHYQVRGRIVLEV